MKLLFYFTGLVLAFIEIVKLTKLNTWIQKIVATSIWNKETKGDKEAKKWDNIPENIKDVMIYMLTIGLFSMGWMGIGLFTFNWEFFLLYLIAVMLGTKLSGKSTEFTTWKVIYSGMWKVIAICFYIFVALNSYHLHIQLGLKEYILSLF